MRAYYDNVCIHISDLATMAMNGNNKIATEKQKLIQDKCLAILTTMLKDDDNKYCVDCDARGKSDKLSAAGFYVAVLTCPANIYNYVGHCLLLPILYTCCMCFMLTAWTMSKHTGELKQSKT